MTTQQNKSIDSGSDDEWVDVTDEPKIEPITDVDRNPKRKRSNSNSDSEYDTEDEAMTDLLVKELLGDDDSQPVSASIKNVKKPKDAQTANVDTSKKQKPMTSSDVKTFDDLAFVSPHIRTKMETVLRHQLPSKITFINFNLAEQGAVVWRDEPAQGNDTTVVIPETHVDVKKWYILSIWFGTEKNSDALIQAPEFKKGKQADEHRNRNLAIPLKKNKLWISGQTLVEKNFKIVFHKKKWPLGRHYASNTTDKTVPLFIMTFAPYEGDKELMNDAIRSDTFIICSKRQPSQLQHARGASTSSRSTGNIRRNKHIARLETENRAHAAQVVKVNADNRRLNIRDEQHTKGFEHLLKMAQHLQPNLTAADRLTNEVLQFVSRHLAKTARSKRATC